MKSKTFVTFEIDDPKAAALELTQQLEESFPLMASSVGLLFCYSDMEAAGLVSELQASVDFPVLGGTAIASMDKENGFHDLSVTLVVLTADDCDFSVAVSDPITTDNIRQQITETYRSAILPLPEKPVLVYALPPYQLNIMLDFYTDIFTEIASGIPFVGGLPSYNSIGDKTLTICNGEVYEDRLVLLVISGNLRPVFTVQTVLETNEIKRCRVTESKNNVIYRVDGQTFTDYLIDIGMPLESITDVNQTVSFVANPLLVQDTRAEYGTEFKYLRALHEVDMKKGSGTAIGKIPENSYIAVHPLDRSEIGQAALLGIRDINAKMAERTGDGYRYSTILAISCIGRYVIMTPNGEVETDNILKELPKDMNLAGFYSYGEISPLPTPGGMVTFAHNESLVLCAF